MTEDACPGAANAFAQGSANSASMREATIVPPAEMVEFVLFICGSSSMKAERGMTDVALDRYQPRKLPG